MSHCRTSLCLALFLEALVGLELLAAPPNITALFPSGGQVGQSVEVTAQGTLGEKPQVWFSREGVKVEFSEAVNKFKVMVAENAAPGICWLRVFNAEGASPLRPFVIGTLLEVVEKEPNNSASDAQKLELTQVVVNGVLEKAGDVDTFSMSLKAGQTLIASLTAKQKLGSPMDGVLQLIGPRGFALEHNDDDHGLDPQIAFTAPAAGDYAIRLFAFPDVANSSINFAGAANYIYRLTVTTGPFVDHALPMSIQRGQSMQLRLHGWNLPPELIDFPIPPTDGDLFDLWHPQLSNTLTLPVELQPTLVEVEPTDSAAAPQQLAVPSSVTGMISHAGDVDVFALKLTAKQQILIRTDARTAGSPIDPVLRIMNPDETVIQEQDDGSKGDFDPDLAFTAPADGEYRLSITDRFNAGGPRFVYRIITLTPQPDFDLHVAADSFVLKDDKPLEIPVTVERQRGFAHDIAITLSGLPEKVTAEMMISAKTGDSAKSVKLVLKSEAGVAFSGPIQISGRSQSEPEIARQASFPLPALGTASGNLWLTVIPAPPK